MKWAWALLVATAAPSLAHAMEAMPGEDRFPDIAQHDARTLSASLTMGQIGEDFFIQVTPRLELNLGQIGFGLAVPLNLRIYDADPKNNNDYGGIIRYEDWDERSEFLKALRYVRLGHKRDKMYIRGGEIAADIGHGTIMNRYLNNIDINTFRVGGQFDLNTDVGGVETMISDAGFILDNAGYVDSKLLGFRGYVKPLGLKAPDHPLNLVQVGFSLVGDFNAPRHLQMEADPDNAGQERIALDGDNFKIAKTRPAVVWGFDTEIDILSNPLIDVIPYMDLNFASGGGWGMHLGTQVKLKVPILIELTLPMRAEYRLFRSDYIPAYFGSFYELERYAYPLGGKNQGPKLAKMLSLDDEHFVSGYYAEASMNLASILLAGLIYEDYIGSEGGNLAIFVSVPALETIQAKAYYARTGVQGFDDALVLDERSMGVLQARYKMMPFFYLVARVTRSWEVDTQSHEIRSNDDWQFGVEFSYEL